MKIWDAELLTAQKKKPVADGLRIWLEASKNTRNGYDPNAAKWEDLSGNGYDFANGSLTQILNKAYVFTGINGQALTCDITELGVAYEAVFKRTGVSGLETVFCQPKSLAATTDGGGRIYTGTSAGNNRPTAYIPGDLSNIHHLYVDTSNRFFVDGTELQHAAKDYWTAYMTDQIKIGSYNGTSMAGYFVGEIYSFKMYNRTLSEKEILQNLNYEKSLRRIGT